METKGTLIKAEFVEIVLYFEKQKKKQKKNHSFL